MPGTITKRTTLETTSTSLPVSAAVGDISTDLRLKGCAKGQAKCSLVNKPSTCNNRSTC